MDKSKKPSSPFISFELSLPSEEVAAEGSVLLLDDQFVSLATLLRALLLQVIIAGRGLRKVLGVYGMILLFGPPGTGKSTLARYLANAVVQKLHLQRAMLLVINSHALPSGERGGCQKNIVQLFAQLAELAATGIYMFLVIDEIETLAFDRTRLSADTNPGDTNFGVIAFFENIDALVRRYPNVFIIATTNLPENVDRAVIDRFDDVFEIPRPGDPYRLLIIGQSLKLFQPGNSLATALRRGACCLLKQRRAINGESEIERQALQTVQPLIEASNGLSPRQLTRIPIRSVVLSDCEIDCPISLPQMVNAAQKTRRTQ